MSGAAEFQNAIRRVGDTARLPGGGEFFASVQPDFTQDMEHMETGAGFPHRYTMYAAINAASAGLQTGGSFFYRDEQYYIDLIETVCLGGQPVYRQGKLRREVKGGY